MLKKCFLFEALDRLMAEVMEAFHTANIQASICVWSWGTAAGLSSLEQTQVVMPNCWCRLSSAKAASRRSGREQEEMTALCAGVSRGESVPSDEPSAVTSWCLAVCQPWGRNEGKRGVEIGSGQRSPFAVHLGSQTNWNSTLWKLFLTLLYLF